MHLFEKLDEEPRLVVDDLPAALGRRPRRIADRAFRIEVLCLPADPRRGLVVAMYLPIFKLGAVVG